MESCNEIETGSKVSYLWYHIIKLIVVYSNPIYHSAAASTPLLFVTARAFSLKYVEKRRKRGRRRRKRKLTLSPLEIPCLVESAIQSTSPSQLIFPKKLFFYNKEYGKIVPSCVGVKTKEVCLDEVASWATMPTMTTICSLAIVALLVARGIASTVPEQVHVAATG